MNHQEFNDFLESVLDSIEETLSSKAEQYAAGGNRFHNFERAAVFDQKRPIDALRGMQTKHRVAIADYLDRETVTDTPYKEWKEKILDNINYYILMLGMIFDEHEQFHWPTQEDEHCPNCQTPGQPIEAEHVADRLCCKHCGRVIE